MVAFDLISMLTLENYYRRFSDFEKADEIYFRLGIIYKQQQKYTDSLEVSFSSLSSSHSILLFSFIIAWRDVGGITAPLARRGCFISTAVLWIGGVC